MGAQALYLLDCGRADMERGILVQMQHLGERFISPFSACLIKTDDGPILVDAGVHPDGMKDPAAAMGQRARHHHLMMTEEDDLRFRLREIGVEPGEVTHIIISHLHWDHAGCCNFFPEATFVIQRAEYRYALHPDSLGRAAYLPHLFEGMKKLDLREGDAEVVRGVSVISTPGHTPGHQAVLVSLPNSGTIVLARDAIYTYENIELDLPGGAPWNAAAAMDSMHRLVHLARWTGGLLLPGHEPDCWKVMRRSPECYR